MKGEYLTINDLFMNLFTQVNLKEQRWIEKNDFNLTTNELRTISKIGQMGLPSFGKLADVLQITPGTLTVSINKLTKKEYVDKFKYQKDKRVVFIGLTQKGEHVYNLHQAFRHTLIKETLMKLNKHDTKELIRLLKELDSLFKDEAMESINITENKQN